MRHFVASMCAGCSSSALFLDLNEGQVLRLLQHTCLRSDGCAMRLAPVQQVYDELKAVTCPSSPSGASTQFASWRHLNATLLHNATVAAQPHASDRSCFSPVRHDLVHLYQALSVITTAPSIRLHHALTCYTHKHVFCAPRCPCGE